MAKKKKEVCPYCGKSFAYLSRHKCKIKERVEGTVDERSTVERRIERIEEKKKDLKRNLRKEEKMILQLINEKRDIYFEDLLKLVDTHRLELEHILEVLYLKSKIKLSRELVLAAWTKHIFSIEDYNDDVNDETVIIDREKSDFIWNMFSRQPCFICPFGETKCNETNKTVLNPIHCSWLTGWMEASIEGQGSTYVINFDEIDENKLN